MRYSDLTPAERRAEDRRLRLLFACSGDVEQARGVARLIDRFAELDRRRAGQLAAVRLELELRLEARAAA